MNSWFVFVDVEIDRGDMIGVEVGDESGFVDNGVVGGVD